MADPHHVEVLDGFDRLTVRLYRTGLALAALGVGALSVGLFLGNDLPGRALVLVGVWLSVWNMHLYDRRIRWVLAGAGSFGGVAWVLGAVTGLWVVEDAGLGFLFVAVSGFALKEQFCFRLPLLRAVPVFLAGGLLPLVLGLDGVAAAVYAVRALVLGAMAVLKARMPLHYDIGDKARYQV